MATILTIPQQQRSGTFGPSTFTIPTGTEWLTALGTTTDAVCLDATKTITTVLEQSFDGGATWQPWTSQEWKGGPDNQYDPAQPPARPGIRVATDGLARTGRVTVTLSSRTSIGAVVDLI